MFKHEILLLIKIELKLSSKGARIIYIKIKRKSIFLCNLLLEK